MKMHKPAIRLISLLLLTAFAVTLLSACGKKEQRIILDEAEIKAAAQTLIQRSVLWNEIFYIEGMRPLEGGRSPSSRYREIDPAYLDEIGFASIGEIRAYGAEIFSPDMTRIHDETLFGSLMGTVGLASSAACMDYEERVTGVSPYPVVNPAESPKRNGDTPWGEHVSYLYGTMRVVYNLNYRATVEITVVGNEEKNEGLTDTVTVQLKKIEGVWYLDNFTFTKIGR